MRSVVLASYRGEKYIGQQLDSILPQLAAEDELIISDDASEDCTLQIVADRHDPRIRVLANRDRVGYIANFQRAIEISRGDRIFFSDQDDVWLPNKVAILESAMRVHACVASDAMVVDHELHPLHPSYFERRGTRSFSSLAIYLKPPIIGSTLACRRDYLQGLLPFPRGVPHDFWLTLNAAHDGALGIVKTPLILYRRHASAFSVSATNNRRPLITITAERARLAFQMLGRRLFHRTSALAPPRTGT